MRAHGGWWGLVVTALSAGLVATACTNPKPDSARTGNTSEAIRSVLARDAKLGTVRNHASETGTLELAVRDYVRGLDELDLSACPNDFATAFASHREAWRDSIAFFEGHNHLRGEMHDLFEEIRATGGEARIELEAHEREIWGTWAEVESAVERHGAGTGPGSDA